MRLPPGLSRNLRWYVLLLFSISSLPALAFNTYLSDFNAFYTTQGTRLDSCGQCHYDFNGGGLRTPYGEDYRNNNYSAVSIDTLDSDGDGFTNGQEADAATLTFPGLNCTNLASALNAPLDIADYADPANPGCIGPGQSPVANPNGPYVAVNGQPLTFSSAGSFDPDGTITGYLWDFGGGFGTSTAANPVFTYNLSFQAKIIASLTVTDNDGNTTTATATVNLLQTANSPPTADAGPAVTGTANSAVLFNGSGSSDPEGARLSYRWDFADGSIGVNVAPSHTYTHCGTYSVGLTVTDDVGLTGTATTTATISSSGIDTPVANAGGGTASLYNGTVGSNVQLDGSTSLDPDCNIASYNWDFGDGSSGLGVNPVHSYSIAGDYVVTLTVTDNDGLSGTATATVTVIDAGVLDGAALYDANCGACHGLGASSTKAGADANRINAGIANVAAMNSLATTLSAAEVQAIADFLVALSPPPPPGGATGASLYDANCGACHGLGASSTKAGADVNRINAGIANVAAMNSLATTLTTAEIQLIADFLVALAPPPPPVGQDGATLYDTQCAGCHGAGNNSTKIGATVARIDAGIANVAAMNSLGTTLTAADIQAISDYLVSLSPPPPPPPPGGSTGSTLYASNCASCHGAGDNSGKAGATAARINNGITNVAAMNFLAGVLSATDVQAIADFLATAAPPTTPEGLYAANCASCHGADGSGGTSGKNVIGDSASGIRKAINKEKEMLSLSFLTDAEVQLISDFLNGVTTPPPPPPGTLDGAALYDTNCAGCHGLGSSSAKAGATAARINNGIANVSSMTFLGTSLSSAEIQAIADFLTAAAPPPPPPGGGGTGEVQYDMNCAGCHGAGANSAKAGATVSRINNGITNVQSMNFLATLLTTQDIQVIADFLATVAAPTTPKGLYMTYCGSCHGTDGKGGSSGEKVAGSSAKDINKAIQKKKEMQFLGFLTSGEVKDIADYLKTLKKKKEKKDDHD